MNRFTLIALAPLAFVLAFWGCDNSTENQISGSVDKTGTCLGCHASEYALKAALPIDPVALTVPVAKGGG